jgi:hypothetical protein
METTTHSTSSAVLTTEDFEVRCTVTIFPPAELCSEAASGIEPKVVVDLAVIQGDEVSQYTHKDTVWSDVFFDLLDLALCLEHFALLENTTEVLEDKVSKIEYRLLAQWAIVQEFFNIRFMLMSKDTYESKGRRYLTLLVFPSIHGQDSPLPVTSWTSPEIISRFASELRACFTNIESASALFAVEPS